MVTQLLKIVYRLIRRAGLVDVVRLMHLPVGIAISRKINDCYVLQTPSAEQLRSAIDRGCVGERIGNPEHLVDGHRAIIVARAGASDDAIIVAYLWLCRDSVDASDNFSRARHLGTSISMPAGCLFAYNAWTEPEHRGRSLVAAMLGHAMKHKVLGVCELLTTMDWTNEPSHRAFAKVGMQHRGFVWRCGRGRLQFTICPKPEKPMHLRIAETAPGMKLAF